MFNPVLNKWGIEGKDMRYVFQSSYLPATFGIVSLSSDWSLYDAENLQAKSIGWDATYMLGLSQQAVENCAEKEAIFKAYRTWENARAADVFTKAGKEKLKDLNYKFHLEQTGQKSFVLYPVQENRFVNQAYTSEAKSFQIKNEFPAQALEFAIRIYAPKDAQADGIKINLPNGTELLIDKKLSDRQFIIYKNGTLYTADKNRSKLEEISAAKSLTLPNGESQIKVGALHSGNDAIKFELVVSMIGKGEKI